MSYNYGSRRPAAPAVNLPVSVIKDVQLSSPPEDTIQELSWSKKSNHLAVASWDQKLRIYDVSRASVGVGKAMIEFEGAVLSCDWSTSGNHVVGAGTDKTARLLDIGANGAPAQQVAANDAPIRSIRFFDGPSNAPMIATGSWDKTIKYWDLRSRTPVGTITCADKVYSMDVKKALLVAATADSNFQVIDLANPMKIFRVDAIHQLKHQTRVVGCFPDGSGYAAGTIEGRCAVKSVLPEDEKLNFSFKCHRAPPINGTTDCYSVNTIAFHPIHGTFVTGGSDGGINIWDKDNRHRIKNFPLVDGPITATSFSNDGKMFAYAVGYDWSKGYVHNTPQHVNKVMIHLVSEEEVKAKESGSSRR